MNHFVANLRRIAGVMAALALFSSVTPELSRAQGDNKPADPAIAPAPADPTARPGKATRVRAPEKSLAEHKKEDGVYAKGSNWLAFKFGYAKHAGEVTGEGFVGYGVAFHHLISRKYAFAGGAGHDVVGKFAQQVDIAVPITAEFERMFRWKGAVQPYVGLGGGFYFRKKYRTGTEYTTTTTGGPHLSIGFTSALDDRHLIGFETRVATVRGRPGDVNPAFGQGTDNENLWTAKLTWALVY